MRWSQWQATAKHKGTLQAAVTRLRSDRLGGSLAHFDWHAALTKPWSGAPDTAEAKRHRHAKSGVGCSTRAQTEK